MKLYSTFAKKQELNDQDNQGKTLLIRICNAGNISAFWALHEFNIDYKIKDASNKDALDYLLNHYSLAIFNSNCRASLEEVILIVIQQIRIKT